MIFFLTDLQRERLVDTPKKFKRFSFVYGPAFRQILLKSRTGEVYEFIFCHVLSFIINYDIRRIFKKYVRITSIFGGFLKVLALKMDINKQRNLAVK